MSEANIRGFLRWAFHHRSPNWVNVTATLLTIAAVLAFLFLTVAAFAFVHWTVGLLMIPGLPLYVLWREYEMARK